MQTTSGTSLSDDTLPASLKGRHRRRPDHPGLWLAVAVLVLALDQITKAWAEATLVEGRPRPLIDGWFHLSLTHNSGAAFSLGTGYTAVLTLVALGVIVVCVRVARRLKSTWWALALGLLLGGALGNVTDRIFRPPAPFQGHVVDFLQLPHWPIFNVADSAITVAAVLIVLLSIFGVHLGGRSGDQRGAEPDHPADDT